MVRERIDFRDVRRVCAPLARQFRTRQIFARRQSLGSDFGYNPFHIRTWFPPHLHGNLDALIGIHGSNNFCARKRPPIASGECDALFHDGSPQ
jgi:hypothetical protein